MKTRMELWKYYRAEINNNMQLQKAVQTSNEKLHVLYERLIKVFPEYPEKYKVQLSSVQVETKEMAKAPQYKIHEFETLLNVINGIEEEIGSSTFIDKIDFSSHELDDVIQAINEKKLDTKVHANIPSSDGIIMKPTKLVSFDKANTEPFAKPPAPVVEKVKEDNIFEGEKEMLKLNIAIDGPSGSGKSTIAKLLAKKYGLNYLNTGLVYRAIAINAIDEEVNLNDEEEVMSTITDGMIEMLPNEKVSLNGQDISKIVRSDEASQGASKVSAHTRVRAWAVALQKHYGEAGGIIMDGRDTTFKILPDAAVKVYLDTTPEIRAKRRVKQNEELGFSVDYQKILDEINERDHRDKNRATDPLQIVKDAIYIDATDMTIDQVVEKISQHVDAIK